MSRPSPPRRPLPARFRTPLRHPPTAPATALAAALLLAAGACGPSGRDAGLECLAPAAPGGGWDLTCRAATRALAEAGLSTGPVRTTNMPGAGGGIAYAHTVTRRRGDAGVLVAASPATTLRLAQGQYGPLTEDDVRWLGALGAEYGIVAVAADAPWQTLDQLMAAWARAPEALVASGGSTVLGQDHVKLLLLARVAGIEPRRVRYVPFDGGGEALTSLLGGFVQVFSGEASEVEGQMAAGNVRVLGVLSDQRLPPPFDAVPTATERGYPVEWVTWRGFYAPAGLPDSVYTRWTRTLEALGTSEAWAEERRRGRMRPFLRVGPEFEAFVQAQVDDFRTLTRELGIAR